MELSAQMSIKYFGDILLSHATNSDLTYVYLLKPHDLMVTNFMHDSYQ